MSALRLVAMEALVIVDQQADFEPKGALAVAGGDEIAKPIAEFSKSFSLIVGTQDSHPAHHISFASSYLGKKPFELLQLDEVESGRIESPYFSRWQLEDYLKKIPQKMQVLWPDHCVQGTAGWKLNPLLPLSRMNLILQKGTRSDCDSYSAFFENDGTSTGLAGYLKDRGVSKVVLVGLAGDYCVGWSAKDAKRLGFDVTFRSDLTRYVNFPPGSREKTLQELASLGVNVL